MTANDEAAQSTALVVYLEDGKWQSGVLPERVGDDLEGLIHVLRQQPADNGAIGLVNVADEYFVATRVRGGDVAVMLSDVTASAEWDLARQVVDRLEIAVPSAGGLDEIRPAGDVGMFADLGVDELELGVLLADLDAYADEMIQILAGRLGFGEVYDRALAARVR